MGEVELLKQLQVCGSLLKCRQILTVQVLHQSLLDRGNVVSGAHDAGDGIETTTFRGTPSSLPRDELERSVAQWPNQDGLQHAQLTDRLCELYQGFFIKVSAWLIRVRLNTPYGNVPEIRTC